MPAKPDPATTINLQAKPGETFFWHVRNSLLPAKDLLEEEIDSICDRYADLEDARAMSVVCYTCVEQLLDGLLDAFIAEYAEIRRSSEFSFRQRIRLARSLRLIPTRIVAVCELILHIRDEFAFNVKLNAFADLPGSCQDKLKQYLRFYNEHPANVSDPETVFRRVVTFTCTALIVYRYHVAALSSYLQSDEFQLHFIEHVKNERPHISR